MAYIKPKMLSVLMTVVACLVSSSSSAQVVTVQVLGDAAWDSGDTRAAGYLNNNNPPDNQLIRGRPRADNPLLLEDTLIAPRLSFGTPPISPPVGPGALKLVTDENENADKATLDRREWDNSPFDPDIAFAYAWLRISDSTPTVAAPALKIGINTTEANPAGDKAVDRGEDRFDKILVYEPYHQAVTIDDIWKIETVSSTQGLFWLVNLDPVNSTLPATNQADLRTLEEWSTAFDASGLGLDAKIESIQLGVGSGNPGLEGYVDYLEFTSGSGTTQWNFGVPEPSTACLLALLGTALLRRQSH